MKILSFLLVLFLIPSAIGVTLISPIEGATEPANIEFTFTHTTEETCELLIDGLATGLTTTGSTEPTTITHTLTEGPTNWAIFCISETSAPRNLQVDATNPTITLLNPTNGASTSNNPTFEFKSNEAATCNLILNGAIQETTTVNAEENKEITPTIADGTYNWKVECEDSVGNTGTSEERTLTKEPLTLTLDLDNSNYNLGEKPSLTITTTDGADVTTYVFHTQEGYDDFISSGDSFCFDCDILPPINSGTFPRTLSLPQTNTSGTSYVYSKAELEGETTTKTKSYTVTNTVAVTVGGDKTIELGQDTTLTAIATGGLPPYTYKWTLHNGSENEGNSIELENLPVGTHLQRIEVTDNFGNKKEEQIEVEVQAEYQLTVTVKDSSLTAIADAAISFNDHDQYTDTSGRTIFEEPAGTYTIFITKQGYSYHSETITLNEDRSIEIFLDQENNTVTEAKPIPLTPENNAARDPGQITFTYRVDNGQGLNCTPYYGQDSWFESTSSATNTGTEELSATAELEEGSYQWYVECAEGTKTYVSQTLSFTVATEVQATTQTVTQTAEVVTEEEDPTTKNIKDIIENAYNNYNSFDIKEKKAADFLEFKKGLDWGIKVILRAARDGHDIKFRSDLSENEKDKIRQELIEKVEELETTIPIDLKVTEKKSFINHAREQDIEKILEEVGEQLPLPTKAIKSILADLQEKLSVSTEVMSVTLTYPDESKEEITLVTHSITLAEEELEDYILAEYIPTTLVGSTDEIVMITEGEVLLEESVLTFPITNRITYYIKDNIELNDLTTAHTLLIPKTEAGLNDVTGASIQRTKAPKFDAKIMLIVLIILLAVVYVGYYFDAFSKAQDIVRNYTGDPTTEISSIVKSTLTSIEENDYDRALLKYRELKLIFEQLPEEQQATTYEDTVLVCNELDLAYLKKIINTIDEALAHNNIGKGKEEYPKMEATFNRLPPDFQKRIYSEIVRVNNALQ